MATFNPQSRFWIFLFFLISGATGLIYEVVWTRLLTLVMGNTHYSVATVLTSFMGGLALGSYLGGRIIDRYFNPLAVYALLEAAIGLYCLLIPALIDWAHPLFKSIYLDTSQSYASASFLRFLICGGILLIPTTFMGATLPVLSKFVSKESGAIGRDVGTLYAVNTFGAVIGALASAFLLMRLWGVSATIHIAAALNLGIAAVIFVLFRPSLARDGEAAPAAQSTGRLNVKTVALLLAFGLSGVSALVYQIAWNRVLSLLLGSSVYAFGLILTTFILGLALGTLAFSRWQHRFADRVKVFGLLQLGIGFSALAVLPLFGEIPFVNRWIYQNWSVDFTSIQFSNFAIIFTLLFVPTFLMGGQFPVVVKLVAQELETLGHNVGRVYASNTVGTIIGSFLGGFVLIPWIGIQNTVLAAVLLNGVLGVLILSRSATLRPTYKLTVLPLALLVALFGGRMVEGWDKAVISSGSFMPYRIKDLSEAENAKNKILFYKEGMHTTVTTELSVSGNIFLRVNGKTDASLALDMRTQLLSGYLPLFFSEEPKQALVIGQGSGITLGAVEQFPVEAIDLVEISPAVIEGSKFFGPFNHQALDDERVNVILEDGRNHVALSDKQYDVIVSEPSNPWISGVGALFTIDFFDLLKKRLTPNGIACIWVHTNMSPDSFKSITRSFSEAFPYVTMWESIVGDDYLLIGSSRDYRLSYEGFAAFLQKETIQRDLARIGIENIYDLMSLMIMDRGGLVRFSLDAPIHTDDNSLLEFSAPRYIYKDDRDALVRQLSPFFQIDPEFVVFEDTDAPARDRVRQQLSQLQRSESQVREIKRQAQIERLLNEAQFDFQNGRTAEALQRYSQILKLDPEHVLTYFNMGNIFKALKLVDKAEAAYQTTLRVNPYYVFGAVALSELYLSTARPEQAEKLLTDVQQWYAGDSAVSLNLGLAHAFRNRPEKAVAEFERALRFDPKFAPAHYYLGRQFQSRDPKRARTHLEQFLRYSDPEQGNPKMKANAQKWLDAL